VTGSGELLATTHHVCVPVPVHPGFGGTPPRRPAGIPALAELHNGLIELLGLQDVTVTSNSIGGWTTAEIALPRSPRVSGSVLITAAIPDPPPGPAPCRRTCQPHTLCPRQALVKHAGIPQPRRNIMGKIVLEEHVILDRQEHLDRWRTLLPFIPEQTRQQLIARFTDTSARGPATCSTRSPRPPP
jgi:pimeloyl-ACP methyl ester carboxylesterase